LIDSIRLTRALLPKDDVRFFATRAGEFERARRAALSVRNLQMILRPKPPRRILLQIYRLPDLRREAVKFSVHDFFILIVSDINNS